MSEQRPRRRREIPWRMPTLMAVLAAIGFSNQFIPPNPHTPSAHPGVDTMPGWNGEYVPTNPKQENRFPEASRKLGAHVCSVVVVERSTPLSEGKHKVVINPVLDTKVGTPATVSLDPAGITLSEGNKLDNYEVYNHQGEQTFRNRLDEAECAKEDIRMVQVHNTVTDETESVVAGQYSPIHNGDALALNAYNAIKNQLTYEAELSNTQISTLLGRL